MSESEQDVLVEGRQIFTSPSEWCPHCACADVSLDTDIPTKWTAPHRTFSVHVAVTKMACGIWSF